MLVEDDGERRATLMEARPRVNATRQRRRRHKSPRLSVLEVSQKCTAAAPCISMICSALAMARYGCELGGDASLAAFVRTSYVSSEK